MRMREDFVAAVGLNRIARFHLDPVINGAMRIFTNRSVMITVSSAHVAPRLPRCLPEKLAALHTDRISQTENGGSGLEIELHRNSKSIGRLTGFMRLLRRTDFCSK